MWEAVSLKGCPRLAGSQKKSETDLKKVVDSLMRFA